MADNMAMATELPVKGRQGLLINQKLTFGEFKTGKVHRSWTKGHDVNLGPYEAIWVKYSDRKQTFRFTMSDEAGNNAETFCIAKTNAEDWSIGNNPNSIPNLMIEVLGLDGPSDNTFAAEIFMKDEAAPWRLQLDIQEAQRNSQKYVGYLAHGRDEYYTLHPVTKVDVNGKKRAIPMGSAGFEIKSKSGVSVAAVSLIDAGKVYISSTEPKEKLLLANACAALLLHQSLD
jgi:hypothetical protein